MLMLFFAVCIVVSFMGYAASGIPYLLLGLGVYMLIKLLAILGKKN